jgi:myo-inositol-1(or 4)-monophosphatase
MASHERRVAIEAARAAGHLLVRELPRTRHVAFKGAPTNLVTEMDARAETLVVETLARAFPDDGVLAEEGSARPGRSGRRWIVDPLDGTTNYAHGVPMYAVGIGLEAAGTVALGVVYEPSRDELFVAERGAGAWLNDVRLSVSETDRLDASLLTTGFPYDIRNTPDTNLAEYGAFSVRARAVRRFGSALIDFAYVAAGRFDGFWELGLSAWDVAAGSLLIIEAGGLIADFDGEQNYLDNGRVVAGSPKVFEQLLKLVQDGRGASPTP